MLQTLGMKMPRNLLVATLFAGLSFAMTSQSQAVLINEYWTSPTTNVNPSSFDDGTQLFAGILTSQITDIGGPGYYHSHGSVRTHNLDILLDGVWTNVWTTGAVVSGDTNITTISTPINFALGVVTGYRFTVDPNVNQGYHAFANTTYVQFDAQVVPEPSSLLMFAGLGLCFGGAAWRKRRKA